MRTPATDYNSILPASLLASDQVYFPGTAYKGDFTLTLTGELPKTGLGNGNQLIYSKRQFRLFSIVDSVITSSNFFLVCFAFGFSISRKQDYYFLLALLHLTKLLCDVASYFLLALQHLTCLQLA